MMTDEWHTFYRAYFASEAEATDFVQRCESINRDCRPPEELGDSTPKIMMHQTSRLVTLAGEVRALPHSHDPLALLFLLVCAECVAKLAATFDGEGRSKAFVHQFFNAHVSDADKQSLVAHFRPTRGAALTAPQVVDLLYDVRCDVVHEGVNWRMSFPTDSCPVLNLHPRHAKGCPPIKVSMRLDEFRDIVVRGCIAAIMRKLEDRQAVADGT